jgi:cell division protein YceG involved in septum cleavage
VSDSDWRDPFADDEAAREREARRAERDRRRRERDAARESLGDRVRQELGGEQPPREPATAEQPAPPAAPPPPRRSPSSAARRRRTGLLVGIGAAIVFVAGAGAIISRSDDDGSTTSVQPMRKTISLTIPEGYDRTQIAAVADKAKLRGNYEKATSSTKPLDKKLDLKDLGAEDADSLEGFLFPATYELFKHAKVDTLVDKQLDAFQKNIDGIDMSYAESKHLSLYDVVIIASMIEREIQVPEERELAASVIYNRLDAHNPLGIDATIRYEDQNYDEPLLQSRLDTDTPYNTHTNAGLPPGPIGNPGLASLEAAAKPAETDYFYYVIKPGTCNEHTFVETEAEFDAAVAEYNAARDAAGGKSPTNCG